MTEAPLRGELGLRASAREAAQPPIGPAAGGGPSGASDRGTPGAFGARTDPDRRMVALPDGGEDEVVVERALLLSCGERSLVTMCTPGLEEAWAVGFLATEGVVRSAADVVEVRYRPAAGGRVPLRTQRLGPFAHAKGSGDAVRVVLVPERQALVERALGRAHEIRASCGVCGVSDATRLLADVPDLAHYAGPRCTRGQLAEMYARLVAGQTLFAATGGCHAAALFTADRELVALAEDVGRHNAVDKAVGAALLAGRAPAGGFLLLSGRAGYDLVIKALRVQIAFIASVSAPSSLAIELAVGAGATLAGFCRGARSRVYAGAGRLIG